MNVSEQSKLLGVIRNIPDTFHSSDLRSYFSQLVEEHAFMCFHYKHRPEVVKWSGTVENSPQTLTKTYVCVVKFTNSAFRKRCIAMYDGMNWINRKGEYFSSKCKISKVSISNNDISQSGYFTQAERKSNRRHAQAEEFSEADLSQMSELRPPKVVMPQGNVGTSIKTFQDLIKQCKLPSQIIKKLDLVFPTSGSNHRFGNVPYNYEENEHVTDVATSVQTAHGFVITDVQKSDKDFAKKASANEEEVDDIEEKLRKLDQREESESDDDTCEEWERHEAFHDDVTSQERSKERLFEEKIELKWEKGGSGLVFYTDAQYWAEEEKDFDEQTADDWDVDMSEFYGGVGDRDAKDFVKIMKEKRLRNGEKIKLKPNSDKNKTFERYPLGGFEQYTRGAGRRIMEKLGWKEGQTLGSGRKLGLRVPLEAEGQSSREKQGVGYRGEKLKPQPDGKVGSPYLPKVQNYQTPNSGGSSSGNDYAHTAGGHDVTARVNTTTFPEQKSVEPLASHSYMFPQFRSNLTSVFREYKTRSPSERKRAVPGVDGIVITTKYDDPLDVDEDSGILRSQFPTAIKRRKSNSSLLTSSAEEHKTPLQPVKTGSKLVHPVRRSVSPTDNVIAPSTSSGHRPTIGTFVKFVRSTDSSNSTNKSTDL